MGKGRYLLKRLIYIVFVFFIISILMFWIYKSMPGDPVDIMLGSSKTTMKPDAYQALYEKEHRMGRISGGLRYCTDHRLFLRTPPAQSHRVS